MTLTNRQKQRNITMGLRNLWSASGSLYTINDDANMCADVLDELVSEFGPVRTGMREEDIFVDPVFYTPEGAFPSDPVIGDVYPQRKVKRWKPAEAQLVPSSEGSQAPNVSLKRNLSSAPKRRRFRRFQFPKSHRWAHWLGGEK
jgi:hypothetical protein